MKTWIISYPRSGNTYTRYLVEFLTERPTKDAMAKKIVSREQESMIYKGDDYVAYKRHDFQGVEPDDRLVFILRNYKECLVRHNKGKRVLDNEFFRKQSGNEDGTYCGLLKRYHEHQGEKMLIYYEDLITAPAFTTSVLRDFFNVSDKRYTEYLKDVSEHSKMALKTYPKSQTQGKSAIHHSKELDKWTKKSIDSLIKKHQPILWNEYLDRYEEIRRN